MTHVIPQGLILGGLLLVILINEIHLVMDKCQIIMYADDVMIDFWADQQPKYALNQNLISSLRTLPCW